MWLAHLSDIPQDRIERAAMLMVDRHPSYPPTIGEFKALIRELNVPKPSFTPSHRIEYDGNREDGNKALDVLRKLTGAKKMPRQEGG